MFLEVFGAVSMARMIDSFSGKREPPLCSPRNFSDSNAYMPDYLDIDCSHPRIATNVLERRAKVDKSDVEGSGWGATKQPFHPRKWSILRHSILNEYLFMPVPMRNSVGVRSIGLGSCKVVYEETSPESR
jgi:hypothetical protein